MKVISYHMWEPGCQTLLMHSLLSLKTVIYLYLDHIKANKIKYLDLLNAYTGGNTL